ncbi:hypothetical protein SH2C18_41440 [Clostridium sediminicola]|uniref:zinc ribbon domain-containing protein n=1 Tax=Clostridium sediminicola TaxID=3114879 RepID=UPI0031F2693E
MDFKNTFNKLKKSASETASVVAKSAKENSKKVADKSGELLESSKLSLKISSEESKISTLYKEIGKITYENYKYGSAIDNSVADLCVNIDEINESIQTLKDQITALKNTSQ